MNVKFFGFLYPSYIFTNIFWGPYYHILETLAQQKKIRLWKRVLDFPFSTIQGLVLLNSLQPNGQK
jgi:hypothetical protein